MEESIGGSAGDCCEVVCFGMIADLHIENLSRARLLCDTTITPVLLDCSSILSKKDGRSNVGSLSDQNAAKLLGVLSTDRRTILEMFCISDFELRGNFLSSTKFMESWVMCVNIYGPKDMRDEVGDFVSAWGFYLQDPAFCELDVEYHNPHLIYRHDEPFLKTSSFTSNSPSLEIQNISGVSDQWTLLKDERHLKESDTPSSLRTRLYSHQKQALTFMIVREGGWSFSDRHDIWSHRLDASGGMMYHNNITGSSQSSCPPDFRGGVLADQMGLGKSITMISLISSDFGSISEPQLSPVSPSRLYKPGIATLLVAPLSLLQTWQDQLTQHLKPQSLLWYVYHGTHRQKAHWLGKYHVVITTFNTLVSEWKRSASCAMGEKTLFSFSWHRVILDEAHIIRTAGSLVSTAVCAIRATNRWAVTGTPIQNRLNDFGTILKFLRVHPFCDAKTFESEILEPLSREESTGILHLRLLVRAIVLCRSNSVANLPRRVDEIHHLHFSPAELKLYETMKSRSDHVIEDAVLGVQDQSSAKLNSLQWLNRLRLICNHGVLYDKRGVSEPSREGTAGIWNEAEAQLAFQSLIDSGNAMCSTCSLDLVSALRQPADSADNSVPSISQCLRLHCGQCYAINSTDFKTCKHNPVCKSFQVRLPETQHSSIENTLIDVGNDGLPTKIKALIMDLRRHLKSRHQKSVIFSYWTYTLDLISFVLDKIGLAYTRIDGSMSPSKRSEAIADFHTKNAVKIMLVSITCGGEGLDLTPASRVYLMEPQWNPMMEEQALCRVYRMGQKNDVTIIRYRIRNSFENKVVLIQDRKKSLANVTFSEAVTSEERVGEIRLQDFRDLLH